MPLSIKHAIFGLMAASMALASPVERQLQLQTPKTPIDADTWAAITKYPSYVTAASHLASGPCLKPPYGSVLEQYINENSTDTQLAIFRNDADREIVLGVPGTASQQDYDTDFTFVPVPYISPNVVCVGCLTHVGFLVAWNSIANATQQGVEAVLAKYPGYSVVISGHSLGGALGQLAFASLKAGGLPVTKAFTYGQPRVGDLPYAKYIDYLAGANETVPGIFHRVTHSNDGVPQLPPTLLVAFVHSLTEYWESGTPAVYNSTYRCYGNEPLDCNDSQGGVGINAAHGEYAGLDYSTACQ